MGVWKLDPYHTQVEFTAKHLGMMKVRGNFTEVSSGSDIDPERPEESPIEVTIQTASINTHHGQRDKHVRSPDFLDVDKYPTIRFSGTHVEATGTDQFTLTGDLMIRDTTRSVTVDVVKYGEINDPKVGHRIAYGGKAQINRKDFGVNFNSVRDGKLVVSDEVQVSIEVELLEQ